MPTLEIGPAYERPVDKASIDARYRRQKRFEDKGNYSPTDFNLHTESHSGKKGNSRLKSFGRVAVLSVGLAGVAAGISKYTGDEQKPMEHPIHHINYVDEGVQPEFAGQDSSENNNN